MGKLLIITLVCAVLLGIFTGIDIGASETSEYMISGLTDYSVIDPADAAKLPAATGTVELMMNGRPLPYDTSSNTYFIPQDADNPYFDGIVTVNELPGYEYMVSAYKEINKNDAINGSIGYNIIGTNGAEYVSSKFIFTSVPAVCIATSDGEMPGDSYSSGEIAVFSASDGVLKRDDARMEIKIRGNTSRRFPKKSYRMKLVDGNGDKFHMSIAGLRADDDWILNAMYTDASKIREKLAYELWDNVNSAGVRAASSQLEFVEVFINGSYCGLYGLQERIDNKQLKGDKRADIIYKVATNDMPTVDELMECSDTVECAAFEVQGDYFGGTAQQLWQPAAAYMSALTGEEFDTRDRIDLENSIDYGLWVLLTQAHDCHFKNQFMNCVYENGRYTIYRMPWDVNHTFGDYWSNDAESDNWSGHEIGYLVKDDLFDVMLASGDEDIISAVKERWLALRADTITEDTILERAGEIFDGAAAAIERDGKRWPECGMGEGNNYNIDDIEAYIRDALPRIDAYIDALGTN